MSSKPNILLIIIILVIVLVVYSSTRKTKKRISHFYKVNALCPALFIINPTLHQIKAELFMLNSWRDFPKGVVYQDGNWKIVPIYVSRKWWKPYSDQLSTLTNLLKQIPNLETAFFSRIPSKTVGEVKQDSGVMVNKTLRCHLGFEINDPGSSYVAVGKERQYHEKGKWFAYDASQLHYLSNLSPNWSNIILVVDITRPKHIPPGISSISQPDEFIKLMDQFS